MWLSSRPSPCPSSSPTWCGIACRTSTRPPAPCWSWSPAASRFRCRSWSGWPNCQRDRRRRGVRRVLVEPAQARGSGEVGTSALRRSDPGAPVGGSCPADLPRSRRSHPGHAHAPPRRRAAGGSVAGAGGPGPRRRQWSQGCRSGGGPCRSPHRREARAGRAAGRAEPGGRPIARRDPAVQGPRRGSHHVVGGAGFPRRRAGALGGHPRREPVLGQRRHRSSRANPFGRLRRAGWRCGARLLVLDPLLRRPVRRCAAAKRWPSEVDRSSRPSSGAARAGAAAAGFLGDAVVSAESSIKACRWRATTRTRCLGPPSKSRSAICWPTWPWATWPRPKPWPTVDTRALWRAGCR